MRTKKMYALDLIEDMVADFFYYNRKEDDVLDRPDLYAMIKSGELTADELVERFREQIEDVVSSIRLPE